MEFREFRMECLQKSIMGTVGRAKSRERTGGAEIMEPAPTEEGSLHLRVHGESFPALPLITA